MEQMLFIGVISALGVFIILLRFGVNFLIRNDKWIDIAFTVGLAFMFFGTFSGMAAAALGGLVLSGLLWLVRIFGRMTGRL